MCPVSRYFMACYCVCRPGFTPSLNLGAHARSEGYCSCPLCVRVSVRSFLPPHASRSRNIGTYVFAAKRKKTFIIVIFAKMRRSEATASFACLE